MAKPAPAPEVLTVDEAAELLRCERKAVYALVRKGELPGVRRIGRAIRIHRATLVAWLEGAGKGPAK